MRPRGGIRRALSCTRRRRSTATASATGFRRTSSKSSWPTRSHHIDFLETQLNLVEQLGLQLYAQKHVGDPEQGTTPGVQ